MNTSLHSAALIVVLALFSVFGCGCSHRNSSYSAGSTPTYAIEPHDFATFPVDDFGSILSHYENFNDEYLTLGFGSPILVAIKRTRPNAVARYTLSQTAQSAMLDIYQNELNVFTPLERSLLEYDFDNGDVLYYIKTIKMNHKKADNVIFVIKNKSSMLILEIQNSNDALSIAKKFKASTIDRYSDTN